MKNLSREAKEERKAKLAAQRSLDKARRLARIDAALRRVESRRASEERRKAARAVEFPPRPRPSSPKTPGERKARTEERARAEALERAARLARVDAALERVRVEKLSHEGKEARAAWLAAERAQERESERREREARLARIDDALRHARAKQEANAERRRLKKDHGDHGGVKPPPIDEIKALAEDLNGTIQRFPGGVTELIAMLPPDSDLTDVGERIKRAGIPAMRVHVVARIPAAPTSKRPYKSSRFSGEGNFDASTRWHTPLWGAISAGNEIISDFIGAGKAIVSIVIELQFA